ncbi:hypothetical protein B566_EDAN005848 [Ephemera danica]|nr:hypothetical protein B566_EDAN005848 [Ephemera danica]
MPSCRVLVYLQLSCLVLLAETSRAEQPCVPGQLAVYRLVLDTHWTRELFPKQYPEFRPPAQWSRLIDI